MEKQKYLLVDAEKVHKLRERAVKFRESVFTHFFRHTYKRIPGRAESVGIEKALSYWGSSRAVKNNS